MTIPGDNFLFGLCALITFGYQSIFYVIAATFKFDKVTDLAGGTNFILLAAVTWSLTEVGNVLKTAANVLVISWGVRLSGYLFYRILMINEDNRFDEMRGDPIKFLFFWVFQFAWVYIVSLPLIFLNGVSVESSELSSAAIAGIAIAGLGLTIEAIADQVKFAFRLNPSNQGKWCAEGIWKYSRHPNYFGEVAFWWGIFIICSTEMTGAYDWAYFTIISPLFTTTLMLFVSGLPILEAGAHKRYKSDPKYIEYLKETSILIPMPNILYKNLPMFIKEIVFFEWKMYSNSLTDEQGGKVLESSSLKDAFATGGNK